METFFPVLGILYWAIDEAVFFSPGTEGAAASLFESCPSGSETSSTYGCDAAALEFGVQPGDGEVLNVVDGDLSTSCLRHQDRI